jgi:hypothetical protein
MNGANDGIRTHDLLITNQLHYHCATLAFTVFSPVGKKVRCWKRAETSQAPASAVAYYARLYWHGKGI